MTKLEALFDAVDDYLYGEVAGKDYPEGHCNPEYLEALRQAFLNLVEGSDMGIKHAIEIVRDLTHHKTYGNLFSLIEEIRQGQFSGQVQRIGQMGALFQLNCKLLAAVKEDYEE